MSSRSNAFKDTLLVFCLGALVFFGALFVFVAIKDGPQEKKISLKEAEVLLDKKINSRISAIEAKVKFKKRKSTRFKESTDSVDQSSRLTDELEIYKAAEIKEKVSEGILSEAIEMVNKDNESEEERRAYIQSYKKEYIRRARLDGWDVKLNDDLEVVSAKKAKPRR